MTDKEKIRKIEEILSGGNTSKVLETAKEEIKKKLHFEVEFNSDGTIKKSWWEEKPKRKPRKKKSETPVEPKKEEIEVVEAEEVKPKAKGKKK